MSPETDSMICSACRVGQLAPRTGPGRVWQASGVDYVLPEDLVVTQCDHCQSFSPEASELRAIRDWMRAERPRPTEERVGARILGSIPPETSPFSQFALDWQNLKSRAVKELDRTIGARLVEHVICGERLMVTMRSPEGRLLGVRTDHRATEVRWLFVRVSKYAWRSLVLGTSSIDEEFADAGEVEVVDYGTNGNALARFTVNYESLPASLRAIGFLPEAERASLRETLPPLTPERACVFDGRSVRDAQIGLYSLDRALHPLASFLEEEQTRFNGGNLSEEPRVMPFAASFGLAFETTDNRSFDEAWGAMKRLLDLARNPERLAEEFRRDPASEDRIVSLLEGIRESGVEVFFQVPGQQTHLSPRRAARYQRHVAKARSLLEPEPRIAEGYFTGFSAVGNSSFSLYDTRTASRVTGRLSRDVRARWGAKALRVVISQEVLYRATLQRVRYNTRRGWMLVDVEQIG